MKSTILLFYPRDAAYNTVAWSFVEAREVNFQVSENNGSV